MKMIYKDASSLRIEASLVTQIVAGGMFITNSNIDPK